MWKRTLYETMNTDVDEESIEFNDIQIESTAKEIEDSLKGISNLLKEAKIENFFSSAKEIENKLSSKDQKLLKKKWKDVKNKISGMINEPESQKEFFRSVLEHETDRDVQMKNRHGVVHRQYTPKDSLLHKFLRLNPTEDVLKCLAETSPMYKASKELFQIVEKTNLVDDNWNAFKEEFNKLDKEVSAGGYGLNDDEKKKVFLVRHTCREDTILSLCARRNPILEAIEMILGVGRESVCVMDCERWGWIPMQYAIAHHARPDVVQALIPKPEDSEYSQYSGYHICAFHNNGQTNPCDLIFEEVDYHGRNPLHWAAYYDAPLETIEALKNACFNKVLLEKDHCGHEPYKVR